MDDSGRSLPPPSIRTQEGGQTTRPLRRRLGAGSAIAAATSPEIRALNLPFTPPVRRDHRQITSLSPSSTSDTASTESSFCSATPSSRSKNISQLLLSLEKFETGGSDRAVSDGSILADINTSSTGLQCSASSAMESILEEGGIKTGLSDKRASKKAPHPNARKVRSREDSGILIPTFTSEIREEKIQTEKCGKEKKVTARVGGMKEKENMALASVPIQPRRQRQRHFAADTEDKENTSLGIQSHPNITAAKLKSAKDGGVLRKKPSVRPVQKGNGNGKKKQASSIAGLTGNGPSDLSKTRKSTHAVPFRERNPNVRVDLSSI